MEYQDKGCPMKRHKKSTIMATGIYKDKNLLRQKIKEVVSGDKDIDVLNTEVGSYTINRPLLNDDIMRNIFCKLKPTDYGSMAATSKNMEEELKTMRNEYIRKNFKLVTKKYNVRIPGEYWSVYDYIPILLKFCPSEIPECVDYVDYLRPNENTSPVIITTLSYDEEFKIVEGKFGIIFNSIQENIIYKVRGNFKNNMLSGRYTLFKTRDSNMLYIFNGHFVKGQADGLFYSIYNISVELSIIDVMKYSNNRIIYKLRYSVNGTHNVYELMALDYKLLSQVSHLKMYNNSGIFIENMTIYEYDEGCSTVVMDNMILDSNTLPKVSKGDIFKYTYIYDIGNNIFRISNIRHYYPIQLHGDSFIRLDEYDVQQPVRESNKYIYILNNQYIIDPITKIDLLIRIFNLDIPNDIERIPKKETIGGYMGLNELEIIPYYDENLIPYAKEIYRRYLLDNKRKILEIYYYDNGDIQTLITHTQDGVLVEEFFDENGSEI